MSQLYVSAQPYSQCLAASGGSILFDHQNWQSECVSLTSGVPVSESMALTYFYPSTVNSLYNARSDAVTRPIECEDNSVQQGIDFGYADEATESGNNVVGTQVGKRDWSSCSPEIYHRRSSDICCLSE